MAKRVFVVCEPTRGENGKTVKVIDVTPAAKWGDLIVVLPSNQSLISPVATSRTINDVLRDFDDSDYIVPVGDPILMCAVAAVAARTNKGRIKFLKWDRRNIDYMVVQVDLNILGGNDGNK